MKIHSAKNTQTVLQFRLKQTSLKLMNFCFPTVGENSKCFSKDSYANQNLWFETLICLLLIARTFVCFSVYS